MTLTSFNPWNDLFSTQGHAEQLLGDAFGRTLMRERLVHALPLDIRQTGCTRSCKNKLIY